jgi:hypothetical protein
MDQGWAAIVAAIAAGVFGITGALLGIFVGRRQATDQATIEHQQWLREQRIEAYLQFQTAYFAGLKQLMTARDECETITASARAADQDPVYVMGRRVAEAKDFIRPFVDRVELLGPSEVAKELVRLRMYYRWCWESLLAQAETDSHTIDWDRWEEAVGSANSGMHRFQNATRAALHVSPSVTPEPEAVWWLDLPQRRGRRSR